MNHPDSSPPAAQRPTAPARRVAGVVLAAGMATRMGGSKVVRPVGGRPMVGRVVDEALASHLDDVVVVVGHEAREVRSILGGRPVRFVENADFAEGLSTSVHAALRSLPPQYDGALFLLADQPFVTAGFIDWLLDEFIVSGKSIVRPEIDGVPGNPVLFSARLFPELLHETGDRGGREVITRHLDEVHSVQVDDPRLCLDVDSPEEYERLREG